MAKKNARASNKSRRSGGARKGARKRSPARKSTAARKRGAARTGAKRRAPKTAKRKAAQPKAARTASTGAGADRRSPKVGRPLARARVPEAREARPARTPRGATEGVDLEVFREQVRFLEESFDDLAAACETAAQRTALSQDLATAQNNLSRAVSAVFEERDSRVAELQREMREGQARIEQLQINEQNIANALNLISGIVRAGASLVDLAT